MAKIVFVDDHELVMDSLKYLVEQESDHEVVGKFVNSELTRKFLLENSELVDLIVLDVKLPDANGIEFAKFIHDKYPAIKIIILSQFSHQEFILSGIRNGASGYLLKSTDGEELTEAIEKVLNGKQYLCQEATRVLVNSNQGENLNLILTPREKEVLRLIANGLTAKEIGEELFIEPSTVDYHKKNLKVKLNAHKISDLTKCAIELGIVDFKQI